MLHITQDQEDKKKEDYRVPTGNLLFRRTGVANYLGVPGIFFLRIHPGLASAEGRVHQQKIYRSSRFSMA